jgi:hypothetical protein
MSLNYVAVIARTIKSVPKVIAKVAAVVKRFAQSTPDGPLETAIFMHLDGILNAVAGQFFRRTLAPMGGN